MKLTGKAKEDFENWFPLQDYDMELKTDYSPNSPVLGFDELHDSMKYVDYVDFADSVGIVIEIIIRKNNFGDITHFRPFINYDRRLRDTKDFKTRPEARTAAVQKFNEIYNERP